MADQQHLDAWLKEVLVDFKTGQVENGQPVSCEIHVKEYLEITNLILEDYDNHWLETNSIALSLALLTHKYNRRKDVVVLTAHQANELYCWGTRSKEPGEREPTFTATIKQKRYIVLPVSDGVLQYTGAEVSQKNSKHGPSATGAHWGLLVVDITKRKSQWFDGLLTLQPSPSHPGKQRITVMLAAGKVAGKILCGIEQLLGSERGTFVAKTAKYVPHQHADNKTLDDPGACGPYMVAFLEYLYKNPKYLSELHRSFRAGNWDKHRQDMGFHSLYTRVNMQKWIQDQYEQSQEDELPLKMTPEVFRILRPKILGPLLATAYRAFDGRRDVVNFDAFEFSPGGRGRSDKGGGPGKGARPGAGKAAPPGKAPPGLGKAPPGTGKGAPPGSSGGSSPDSSEGFSPGSENNGKKIYDTDDEDDDDNFIYNNNEPEISISKEFLRAEIRRNLQAYDGIGTKKEYYRRAFEILRERQKAAEKPKVVVENPAPQIPQRRYQSKLSLPASISGLPLDFGDEKMVSPEQLEVWRKANKNVLEGLGLDDKAKKATNVSFRAALHVLSGITFDDETDDRLSDIWLDDPEVFNTEERKDPELKFMPGVIASRLKDRYEIFERDLLPRGSHGGSGPGGGGPGSGGSGGGPKSDKPKGDKPTGSEPTSSKPKGDKSTGGQPTGNEPTGSKPKDDVPKGQKTKSDRPKDDKPEGGKLEGGKLEGGKPEGGKPKGDKPKGDEPKDDKSKDDTLMGDKPTSDKPKGKQREIPYPNGKDAKLPNFATAIAHAAAFTAYQQLNADLFPNNDYNAVNVFTRRAVLHRTYKGSFKGEAKSNLRNSWYKDPHAFTKEEQKEKWNEEDIAQRMDDIYMNLDLPLFISLSDSEVETWMKNLPADVRGRMMDVDGQITHEIARGLLHRLFVGEFEELRAVDPAGNEENSKILAAWLNAYKDKFSSVDEAIDAFISLFGDHPEPFLAASPLHWPSREYLLSRKKGEKRKQPSDPEGAPKTKKSKK